MKEKSIDLIDAQSDWGLTVSEAKPRKNLGTHIMIWSAYGLIGVSMFYTLPVVAGFLLFPDSNGLWAEAGLIAAIIATGFMIKFRAGRLPRNAVQIDYKANEVRLGTQKPDGTFIRQKVFAFRDIDHVYVNNEDENAPKLCLGVRNNTVTIAFNQAESASVEELGAKIAAARESALRTPVRSRVQSGLHSIEASVREIRSRVRSTIAHA